MPKLKVYRTPIGFHDAYVAASSQKAALEAWGSDANLFARGVAEQVDDPELAAEPLAHPGTVIKKLRGTLDQQLAALPRDTPAQKQSKPNQIKPKKAAPRPSRASLDKVEGELAVLRQRHEDEERALARKEAELASERRKMAARHAAEQERLTKRIQAASRAYEAAMSKWRD